MKRVKQYLVVIAVTLFMFGCGSSPSEKAGFDEEPLAESSGGESPGKVADVSKIDHSEYLDGSHQNFTCSDCHRRSKAKGNNKSEDKDDSADDDDDDNDKKDGDKRDRKDKDKKKHRDHNNKKDDEGNNNSDDSDDSGDSDGSSDSSDSNNSGGSDEVVHTDDFSLCANCHSGYSQEHTSGNFSTRCNECHKSGNGNWLTDLRYSYDHTDLTNCVNCHARKGNENVSDHNGETCANCHVYGDWEDTPSTSHTYTDNCKGCHSDESRPSSHPDNSSTDTCETCHSYSGGWKNGSHQATTGCADCHDLMAPDMGSQCQDCHEYGSWTPTTTGGSHSTTGCSSCHAADVPSSHPSNMDTCEACHDFDSGFKSAVHESFSTCSDCHTSTSNRSQHDTGLQCRFCHSDVTITSNTGSGNTNSGGGNNSGGNNNSGSGNNSGGGNTSGGTSNTGGGNTSGGGSNSGTVTYPIHLVGTGNIGECKSSVQNTGTYKTGLLLDDLMNTYSNMKIFVGGDNQYNNGDQSEYDSCYSMTKWGDYVQQTPYAIIGDHDKTTYSKEYFNNSLLYDAYTGDNGRTYWSEDVGSWHIIGLNTEQSVTSGSAQYQWLEADLSSNDSNSNNRCTIAMMHRPRYSTSANGDYDTVNLFYLFGSASGEATGIFCHSQIIKD